MDEKWLMFLRKVMKENMPDGYRSFIFGSRADGSNRKYSDVDIGVMGDKEVPRLVVGRIQRELEESRLPYRADVVDLSTVTPQFRKIALRKVIDL